MISISKTSKRKEALTIIAAGFLFVASFQFVAAQSSMSLSVSPTLYEMTAEPGQIWQSTIRVINPNPYPLTVYLDTVNFEPTGESGQPRFLPIVDAEMASTTLAGWIEVGATEVTIPAEQTSELPFTIAVPENAPPGGHFASVLVGTRPSDKDRSQQNQVETSQIVTSLVFLRVSGSVLEEGSIRSFRTTQRILSLPETTFELRFENTGNVHVLPQGQIEIYNMWGQERGVVPINQAELFGNVLPDSVRKYTYNWTGEWSVADIGRYRAIVTVAFGNEDRQFATADTSFWVIPWKPLLVILLVLFGFIFFITTLIRWYVRRVMTLAGVSDNATLRSDRPIRTFKAAAPLTEDMLDLRSQFRSNRYESGFILGLYKTIQKNYLFFLSVAIVLVFGVLSYWFIKSALIDSRGYEVEIVGTNDTFTVTSEDIAYEEARAAQEQREIVINDVPDPEPNVTSSTTEVTPNIQVVNRSGLPGLAARLRLSLENSGVEVAGLDTDLGSEELNTVIVYDPVYAETALELSQLIEGSLLSAYAPDTEPEFPIVIYVGLEYADAIQ